MDDDEFKGLRPRNLPHDLPDDLQSWNLADLTDYITSLKAEITRVEAKIDEKKAVGNAAASLFKS